MRSKLRIFLLIFIFIYGYHATIQDIKIISMANQNITLSIDQNASYVQGWSYQDLGTDKIVELNLTNENFSISPFKFVEAGRKYYLKNLITGQIVKKFQTIGIDDKCEVKDNKMGTSVLSKGEVVILICSIKVKKNLLENKNRKLPYKLHSIDDPIINWFMNQNLNATTIVSKFNENDAVNTIEWDNDNTIKYLSKITLKIPLEDELVWKMKNNQITCQVSHESSYEIDSGKKLQASTLATTLCNYHLNINFRPFLSTHVNETQFIQENQLSVIECPVKAPNFQPYKYSINWYHLPKDSVNETWAFKYSKTYDKSGDLYVISNAKYDIDDGLYKCELIDTKTHSVVLNATLNVIFNSTHEFIATQKSSSITISTLSKVAINALIVIVFIIIIIILALKLQANKNSMRVTNEPVDNLGPLNNQANLKYELKNLRPNLDSYPNEQQQQQPEAIFEDDQVYKENSVIIRDDDSIMKKLANIDTKKCVLHLAKKIKHKKTCELYQPTPNLTPTTNTSFNETITTAQSTYRTIATNLSEATLTPVNIQINQKTVQFNLNKNNNINYENDYDSSEYMESIYINGYK